jgi:hypothetical protein
VNVLGQFGLCVGRPGDENRTGIRNRFRDGVKVVMIFGGVSATNGIGFMMDVARRMIWVQDKSLDVRRAEMENAGFAMIDPDDGMMVMFCHETKPLLTINPR